MKQLHKVNVSSHSLWTVTEQSLLSSLPLFSISSASSSTNIFIDRVLKLLLLIMSYDHNKGVNYKKMHYKSSYQSKVKPIHASKVQHCLGRLIIILSHTHYKCFTSFFSKLQLPWYMNW